MDKWLQEIATDTSVYRYEKPTGGTASLELQSDSTKIIFAKDTVTALNTREQCSDATVCCVEDKTYNKRLSPIEHQVLKRLASNKARFYSLMGSCAQ